MLSFCIMSGYPLQVEVVRAYSNYGDAVGAERVRKPIHFINMISLPFVPFIDDHLNMYLRILKYSYACSKSSITCHYFISLTSDPLLVIFPQYFNKIRSLKMLPSIEANHYVMLAYASLGKLTQCDTFLENCLYLDFKPSNITINILLAAHLYNCEGFNIMAFMSCFRKYFVSGDLKPNRFTYIQLLLGCEKARSTTEAVQIFDVLLKSRIQITGAMRETFRRTVGDRLFEDYVANLDPILKERVERIDELEEFQKKKLEKPIEFKMKPGIVVLGTGPMTSKRVYVPKPPTNPR